MPDTHINAFFADVDEKAEKVKQANAEYREAQLRLEAKKKAIDWKEPQIEESAPERLHQEEPQEDKTAKKK